MNLLEKIGWMSGIAALVATQIPSIFGDNQYVKIATFVGSLAVLGITAFFHWKKPVKKQSIDLDHSYFYPFLDKESRTKYHDHLIRDICQVIEKQMQAEKLLETNALFRLLDEKQNVIISHFFTAEFDSDKYDGLYTTYRSLLEFERSMVIQSKKVYDYLNEIEKDLLRLHHDNYSTTKYTLNDFFLSLGISNKTELLDFYKIKDTYQKLMGYRQIINFQEGDEFVVRINKKDVFKSSSWDISHKCEQMLIQKFEKFEDPFSEAWYSTKYEVYDRLAKYDTTIRNNFEFIRNVEPIIGCCAGCLQYFIGDQKSKFEKLLSQFEIEEKPKLAKI